MFIDFMFLLLMQKLETFFFLLARGSGSVAGDISLDGGDGGGFNDSLPIRKWGRSLLFT